MNDRLRKHIEALREKLRSEPAAPLIGDIPGGIDDPKSGSAFWDEFLKISDGGRYGSVDLFASRNLAGNQFWLEQVSVENAIVVGQVLYAPVVLEAETNHLLLLSAGERLLALGHADDVIETCFLGSDYIKLEPSFAEDEWAKFVR